MFNGKQVKPCYLEEECLFSFKLVDAVSVLYCIIKSTFRHREHYYL